MNIIRDFGKDHGPCVYFDTSSKGNGRRHKCWRAEMSNGGKGRRLRHRFSSRIAAEKWLAGIVAHKQVFAQATF